MLRSTFWLLCFTAGIGRLIADENFSQPPYPEAALLHREQGTVKVLVEFQTTGAVKSVRILNSSGSQILDRATSHWILTHWKASPQMLANLMKQSGRLSLEGPVSFQLDNATPPPAPGNSAASLGALNHYLQEANNEIENHWNRLSILRTHTSTVHVRITIYSDGHATGTSLDPSNATTYVQLSTEVALAAIQDAAPFPPFSAEMKREVAQSQHNDGSRISEDFSFVVPSRYGP
jgi:TonB family protein